MLNYYGYINTVLVYVIEISFDKIKYELRVTNYVHIKRQMTQQIMVIIYFNILLLESWRSIKLP